MKSSISSKLIVVAALAVAGFAAASAAHARSDVYFSIGVQGAPVYVEPAPVYVQPRPVYVQPRPVYVQPPVYVAPAEVYLRSGPPVFFDNYDDDDRAWRRAEWRRRHWRHHRHEWDQYPSRGRDWD
jgi:hypothetical protein